MENKLDKKDLKILRELDMDYRQSFSKIARKVGLSKNSINLRFKGLQDYISHIITGINNEILGYTMVKVFYSFDFYNEKIEREIISEIKRHKNMLWAAKFYGQYDLCICLLVNNINDMICQINSFNNRFAKKINKKEIQIIYKQFLFRNNFLHEEPIAKRYFITKTNNNLVLSDTEKKILSLIRYDPKIPIIEIAKKIKINPKTVKNRIGYLEKTNVIMGYFMAIKTTKFNFDNFKLLIQVQREDSSQEFENYISSIKNVTYITKMLGLWDYEIDMKYQSITDLQKQLELIKEKFPNVIKKVVILSFGKRIATNKENFLM